MTPQQEEWPPQASFGARRGRDSRLSTTDEGSFGLHRGAPIRNAGSHSAPVDGRNRDTGSTHHPNPAGSVHEWRARQQAGLDALVAIATQVTFGMPVTASTAMPVSPPDLSRPPQRVSPDSVGVFGGLLSRAREDRMVRNSLYLMLSTALQAGLGSVFWVVAARLFTTAEVGKATSLISATIFIAQFALLGFNGALVRFLPTTRYYNSLVTAALLACACAAALASFGYVQFLPIIAPALVFVEHQPAMTLGFVLLSIGFTINMLTDAVFMAARRAEFCALTDGAITGLSKILGAIALAGAGAYGLLSASAGGSAVAALASLALIIIVLRWRPSLQNPFQAIRPVLKFAGANYISNVVYLMPPVVIPIIVLDRLGTSASAYYYIVSQLATLLYAAVYAVETAFFAEGSQSGANWRIIRRRSRALAVVIFVPGGLVLAAAAHWILLIFGSKYSAHGTFALQLMALALVPLTIFNWSTTVLRLLSRLRSLVLCSVLYTGGICGSAWALAPHGLDAVAVSWLVGGTLAALVATAVAASASRRARHRKTKSVRNPSPVREAE